MRIVKGLLKTLPAPAVWLSAAAVPALAANGPWGGNGGWGGGWGMGPGMMGGWGMGWFGSIFMILFWILILAGLVAVIKWLFAASGRGRASGDGDRALDILRERYARGEIDKAEYDARKADLAR